MARLLAGPDADLGDVIADITADEHVPYLAQLRHTGEGLLKRAQWEQTWDLRQRGKLDVPEERFISYPGASPGSDDSLLLGWAGWDHREQGYALVALIEERSATDGWECGYLATKQELCSFTEDDLRIWTPPQPARGRRARP